MNGYPEPVNINGWLSLMVSLFGVLLIAAVLWRWRK